MTPDPNTMKLWITANEKLFDKWKNLGQTITLLGNIVQNDIELSSIEFAEWVAQADKAKHELKILTELVFLSLGDGTNNRQVDYPAFIPWDSDRKSWSPELDKAWRENRAPYEWQPPVGRDWSTCGWKRVSPHTAKGKPQS
jgi:hypothetical protein